MIIIFWLRSLVFAAVWLPVTTLLVSAAALLHFLLTKRSEIFDQYAQIWAQLQVGFLNIEVIYKGEANIPEKSCLFLFNHTSFVDIFCLQSKYSHIKFGAKIELFSIPVFGAALRAAGMLPIARGNREEVFKVYQQALVRVEKGEQFALSPEGGRNANESLLPFKAGPFVFAINAKIPVVPVIIKGAHAAWGKKMLLPQWRSWSTRVVVEFLPAVSTVEYDLQNRQQLQAKVYSLMQGYFI